jgi:hypothetical protein
LFSLSSPSLESRSVILVAQCVYGVFNALWGSDSVALNGRFVTELESIWRESVVVLNFGYYPDMSAGTEEHHKKL